MAPGQSNGNGYISRANGNGYISRGSLTAAIAGGALLLALFSGFFSYQNTATDRRINDLQGEILENRKSLTKLTADNSEYKATLFRLDSDRSRLDAELLRLRPLIVSREEHDSKDRERKTIIEGIALRVDRMERDFGGTVTIGSELKRLQTEVSDLRALLFNNKTAVPK